MFHYKIILLLFVCCLFTVAKAQKTNDTKQRYVILKLDDVVDGPQGQVVSDRWLRVTKFIEEKKIKAAFGVIGYSLVDDNPAYFQWIKEINKGGLIEFWNHGFYVRKAEDTQGEFEKDYDTQLQALLLTDSLAKAKLGITFNTWGPHWSGTNEDTDQALTQVPSIKMAFGYPPNAQHYKGIVFPHLIDLEYPVHNPDFNSFIAEYKKMGETTFLSYLQGHPNSWDDKRWEEFVKIIEFLITENITFITPSEYYFMENQKSNAALYNKIMNTDGFVALWDFKESSGENRQAVKEDKLTLVDVKNNVPRVAEGPLSGYSASFDGQSYLLIPNKEIGKLNITTAVTVIAWVKWTGEQTGFIAGPWNEYADGGKRQYGLFVSLPYYNGKDQVCGHISKTGKPTPPFPYSIDYSASNQSVPKNEWCCVAFTYDGEYIKSYLNGEFEAREPELINHTTGFEGYPDGITHSKNPYYFPDGMDDNGSDFTVGSVLLKSGMGNFYKGLIGGVAVFSRALSEKEMKDFK